MTKEDFGQDILRHLEEQRLLHPAMEQADVVKQVFQAMLGVGHLLSGREETAGRIAREMNGLPPDPDEPLFEVLSPAWCRLNLRRAMAEQLSPGVIAGLMIASGAEKRFSRMDVLVFCKRLAQSDGGAITDPDPLGRIPDETWLPSHSEAYRERYHPAYRVISTEWIPYLGIIREIAGKLAGTNRLLVTIDGPCASGKTTLAHSLAQVFGAAVVHTDDFVVPHAQKTAARLAVPGGNCDAERLVKETVEPWMRGGPAVCRKYDCGRDCLLPGETLPESNMLLLEGSYCNLPVIRVYAGFRLFMDTPEEIRMRRLRERESPESLRQFMQKWIPLENAYFKAYGLPDPCCRIIK